MINEKKASACDSKLKLNKKQAIERSKERNMIAYKCRYCDSWHLATKKGDPV